ncbi:hypothetical protein EVC11_009 [Rhizobium phage RHph_I20]|uniref:Transmembrane protein n=1 Tax=Rhizobium phage RHph_I20 TaxID=2509730 RepID=A0A7S5RBI8_9CAUD|nr:hypothetical protein EVC11_009 [Rhizobium phage RHph_I20]
MDHRPPETRSRSAPLYDLAIGLGRIEGMVGQALTSLTDHSKRLDEHDKRLNEIEKHQYTQKGYIMAISAVAALIASAIGWLVEHWDKLPL